MRLASLPKQPFFPAWSEKSVGALAGFDEAIGGGNGSASDYAEYDRSPCFPFETGCCMEFRPHSTDWGRPDATPSSARPAETGVGPPLREDRPQYRRLPGESVRDPYCDAGEWPT